MAKKSELVKDLDAGQQLLRVDDLSQSSGIKSLSETFRRLYYRLYSNSAASRAERLFENLAIVLLLKFCVDKSGDRQALDEFLKGPMQRREDAANALSHAFAQVLTHSAGFHLARQINP